MFRKITLVGNVGKKPEIKNLQNGGIMATFSMAVNEKQKDGEQKTSWFDLVAFQKQDTGLVTGLISKYVDAGTMLFVEGTPNNRQWTDKEGKKRYSFEVVLDFNSTVKLLSSKAKSHGSEDRGDTGGEAARGSGSAAPVDDDIPF